jgi:hypothetical protein
VAPLLFGIVLARAYSSPFDLEYCAIASRIMRYCRVAALVLLLSIFELLLLSLSSVSLYCSSTNTCAILIRTELQ